MPQRIEDFEKMKALMDEQDPPPKYFYLVSERMAEDLGLTDGQVVQGGMTVKVVKVPKCSEPTAQTE